MHPRNTDHECENRKDDDEYGEADHRPEDYKSDANRVDEHVFWFSIRCLEAFLLVHFFVKTNASELNYDEADVHGELEENEADALGNELVRGGTQVDGDSPEHSEAGNDKGQLGQCLANPNLLVP